MGMVPQISVKAGESEAALSFFRQMGIEGVSLGLSLEQIDDEFILREKERLLAFGLRVTDAYCMSLQKNKSIILGLPDRDEHITQFIHLVHVLGRTQIPFTSVAWQPNGVLRTKRGIGQHTRGGYSSYVDEQEILSRPISEDREYSEEEVWDNFAYFLQALIPECEKSNVRLALHPNDPPMKTMQGVESLIWRTKDYDRAFKLADSPMLGMKLCVGCWLEGGDRFGDVLRDIRRFCRDERILCVHFRNVDSPLPRFEETLAEDGYGDMYAIMKELVANDCAAVISIDHPFRGNEELGGRTVNFAYPTGFMKGLMWAAEKELGKR